MIENSLRLDRLSTLPDLLRHIIDLHDRVGLDDPQKVLFE